MSITPIALTALIVAAFLWITSMMDRGSFSGTLPLAYRIQATLLTLILVLGGAMNIDFCVWGAFNPHAFLKHFQQSPGFFAPQVSVAIGFFSSMASLVAMVIGFKITQRTLRGFDLAVLCAPYLFVIDMLAYTRVAENHVVVSSKAYPPEFNIAAWGLLITLNIVFYLWLYRFSKSPKNRQFILVGS